MVDSKNEWYYSRLSQAANTQAQPVRFIYIEKYEIMKKRKTNTSKIKEIKYIKKQAPAIIQARPILSGLYESKSS